jgi:hypothetical protein
VRGARASLAGTVSLKLPQGWSATPASAPFTLKEKGDEATLRFTLTAPAAPAVAKVEAVADVSGQEIARGLTTVDYPHIPVQVLFPPSDARLVRLDVAADKREVGYIMGSGDEVPDSLRQLGWKVTLLSDEDLETQDLSRYGTIVAGVRAYNTRPRLKPLKKRLMDYVEKGGSYVVQYATTSDLVTDDIGPYPFKISRDRVTDEDAKVTFTKPGHPLLTTPNRIAERDFEGWIQERGLYFASESGKDHWDARYETPIACHDAGEGDKAGGLLYAHHGKGAFVYTGYSFFRELPAGVPGAIRLFANLVEAGTPPRISGPTTGR